MSPPSHLLERSNEAFFDTCVHQIPKDSSLQIEFSCMNSHDMEWAV